MYRARANRWLLPRPHAPASGGVLCAASVAQRIARDEECAVLAQHLLETLLAVPSTAPYQRREFDLESTLRETSA